VAHEVDHPDEATVRAADPEQVLVGQGAPWRKLPEEIIHLLRPGRPLLGEPHVVVARLEDPLQLGAVRLADRLGAPAVGPDHHPIHFCLRLGLRHFLGLGPRTSGLGRNTATDVAFPEA
jgi:hypothetical protein